MRANLQLKKEQVSILQDNFKDSISIIFVNYQGITVSQDTELRKQFRNENITYKVVKNRLLTRALDNLGINDYDKSMFEGSTAVAYSKSDETAPARIFCENAEKFKKMEVKFGIVNGKIMNKSQVEALAKIPSKPVLISMLMSVLLGPMSSLVRGLDAIAKKN